MVLLPLVIVSLSPSNSQRMPLIAFSGTDLPSFSKLTTAHVPASFFLAASTGAGSSWATNNQEPRSSNATVHMMMPSHEADVSPSARDHTQRRTTRCAVTRFLGLFLAVTARFAELCQRPKCHCCRLDERIAIEDL